MMEKEIDLIGFGDPFLDLVVKMETLPKTNTSCQMQEYGFQGGGNVPTAVVAASRLGLRTSLIGCVGDDLLGRVGLSDLKYNGVDVSRMSVQEGKKSNFCICVTERAIEGKEFISKPGDFTDIQIDELDEDYIKSAKMIHVALITPAVIKACEWIHEAGGKVSIDANYYRPYVYENYQHIDIFIGSELYYHCFCENNGLNPENYRENMALLKSKGPEIVIFTFGSDGCKGVYESEYFEIPAFQVDVVDTTGAGDVFHGAFDYFYLQGLDVETCAYYATGVSAIKCTRPGGRSGIPTISVLEAFMKTGEIDYTEIDERVKHYKKGINI